LIYRGLLVLVNPWTLSVDAVIIFFSGGYSV